MFIEQNVNSPVDYSRMLRWHDSCLAWGGSCNITILPFTMTDSGYRTMSGYSPTFSQNSRTMVNTSLARPPGADISAQVERIGNSFHFDIQVTNRSGVTLSPSNEARVYAMIYETKTPDHTSHLTSRIMRASVSTGIASLANLATADFSLDTGNLSGVVWENLHPVVIVDYRPGGAGSGYYDMLQAAFEYFSVKVHLPLVMKH